MTRRTTKSTALSTPAASTPARDLSALPSSDDPFHADVALLRRQWKWAAFSQFFYTFATLLAMDDVTLTDVEDDLTRSTSIVLPRIMLRLLYTLSPDRRLSLDNWQTSLRKQYYKRDPQANPIGPEPVVPSPSPSPEPPEEKPQPDSVPEDGAKTGPQQSAEPSADAMPAEGQADHADISVAPSTKEPTAEPSFSRAETELQSIKEETRPSSMEKASPDYSQESKDWLQLPMLEKLDSLWLLTEWQFQKPQRVRQLMRDDDDTAQWRIEPIGYDAKANAYWLIGPDRLWLQRVPPRPPRSLKRKRPAAKSKKAKRPAPADEEEFVSDVAPSPKKRKAAAPAQPKTPPRNARTRRQATTAAEETPSGRGSRAAKTQANLKLDKQAKELAELKRLAAMESKQRNGRRGSAVGLGALDDDEADEGAGVRSSARKRRAPAAAPAVGTRVSARLRGAREAEAEWQEVPEDWLMEGVESTGEGEAEQQPETNGKGKGKAKAVARPIPKTGLESDDDSVSELTELSVHSPSDHEEAADDVPAASTSKKAANGKSSKSKKKGKKAPEVVEEPEGPEHEEEPAEEPEPEWHPPDDFVEWETVCVTLFEWEHIAERFEKATHYAEKALYKVLSQHLVPVITAELREIERKRRLEEAVTHRKRSSRLALRESEKEEARLAALRKAEEEEKQSRARRLEARIKKEEEERQKRENAREKRRREREEREERTRQRREQKTEDVGSSSIGTPVDVENDEPAPSKKRARPSQPAPAKKSAPGTASGSRTPPSSEDWELDCEICHRRGVNKDDGTPLLCCGKCGKWQHITCHDYADRLAGRPKRNWDVEEFVCAQCRAGAYPGPQQNGYAGGYPTARQPYTSYAQPGGQPAQNNYGNYGQPSSYARGDGGHDPSAVPSRSHTAITFTHYQPQQHGFSKMQPTHAHMQMQPYPMNQSYPGPGSSYGVVPDVAVRTAGQYHNVSDTRSMDHGGSSSQSSFVPRQYVPNGTPWPSNAAPSSQPPANAAWAGPSTNGYGHSHYNASAERSSAGPSYERGVPPAGGMSVPIQDGAQQQWARAHPHPYGVQGNGNGNGSGGMNTFPPVPAQEQYHYSAGHPQQHRAP
ncbi:hypothetical protein DENSPDRAFT_240651 [Dentipellis sp. KUC8613]|nr:hypothetical protein DENSPDRAFT_240651 [Dentipellis sp. KUC8613]